MRRSWPLTVAGTLMLMAVSALFAQDSAGEDPAVVALDTSLEIKETLLDEDRDSYRTLVRKRTENANRLELIHSAIDIAVASDDPGSIDAIERLVGQLEQAEGERAELQATERVLVDRIRDRLRTIAMLEERLAELRGRPRPESGVITGTWDVVLLPIDQRGTFELTQDGAIVTGTYRLSGGFTGSLQGTLVKTKLYLERIDSQLGRSMEFEGRLSGEQDRIRGTWLSYELADGDGSNGHWSATRRGRDDDSGTDDGN